MKPVEISELRKHLKSIGFNVKTKTLGIGISCQITHGNEPMPDFFNGDAHRSRWLPAILLLQQEYAGCTFTQQGSPTFGLQRYCNGLK
jgi:hypothetical protein